MTKTFARSFDGEEVKIGDVKFIVTESLIAEATGLPRAREKWFKNRGIKGEDWKIFLKNPSMDITVFREGIPSSTLKSKWRNLLLILHKFVTFEGRFGCVFFYHIRLLMNFLEEH